MKIIFLDRDGVINRFPGIGKYATRNCWAQTPTIAPRP
jgi:histidinol phosphatase-like enzyme